MRGRDAGGGGVREGGISGVGELIETWFYCFVCSRGWLVPGFVCS